MADDRAEDNRKTGTEQTAAEPKPRKTWQRPSIQSGPLFEANTVSCTKQPGNPGCGGGPFTG